MEESVSQGIEKKSWDIRTALFSHTPMTEKAGRALSEQIRETQREFEKVLYAFRPRPKKDDPIVSSFKVYLEPGESLSQIM